MICVQKCLVYLYDSNTKDLLLYSPNPSSQSKEGCSDLIVRNGVNAAPIKRCVETKRIPLGQGITGSVALEKKYYILSDAAKDVRFQPEYDQETNDKMSIRSMVSVPILGSKDQATGDAELVGVANLYNKVDKNDKVIEFDEMDVFNFQNFLVAVGLAISNSNRYENALLSEKAASVLSKQNEEFYAKVLEESNRIKILLEFAKSLYKEDDVQTLNRKIILHARDLLKADRASVFVVDRERKELYSSVFDTDASGVIRFPITKGISGFVASSGQIVNLPDAYLDPRFNPEIDIATGYRTKSMLSIPIFGPSKDIVAVASLINKKEEGHSLYGTFSNTDIEVFEAFAAFCGLALHKNLLLEETKAQRRMLSVTMELMSYHSSARQEDITNFQRVHISNAVSLDSIRLNSFNPHTYEDNPDALASFVLQMFQDLNYVTLFSIEESKLVPYILTVRRNYRQVLYHNFGHAVSVSHAMYLIIKHTKVSDLLSDLELFSMFIASLNHDIDHRGTNNQFQKSTQTPLAGFYSTSTMERHHFNHAMTILSNERLNILERMNSKNYRECLEYMEAAILATDLATYFSNRAKAAELAKSGKYDKNNSEHRSLLKSIMMTCADLSAMSKKFEEARSTANNVFREFYLQGDQEKKLGLSYSSELMDREKMYQIPRMQVEFYSFIVIPAYEILHDFLGDFVKPWLDVVVNNMGKWKEMRDRGISYSIDDKSP